MLPQASLHMGGWSIDVQAGASAAVLFNPAAQGETQSLLGTLLMLVGTVLFFTLDLHLDLYRLLVASAQVLPLGQGGRLHPDGLFGLLGGSFLLGLVLVAPVVLALLAVDIGAAYATRSMPQANVYFLALPFRGPDRGAADADGHPAVEPGAVQADVPRCLPAHPVTTGGRMSQPDQDKTEQPTPHHLEQARQRGEVAKSADVSGSLVLVVFVAALAMTVGGIAVALANATRRLLALAGNTPELNAAFAHWTARTYGPVGQAVLPLVLALVVTGVLGNVLQTGPMCTTQPLKPDFKRMNPANALRRIFSMRTLWELGDRRQVRTAGRGMRGGRLEGASPGRSRGQRAASAFRRAVRRHVRADLALRLAGAGPGGHHRPAVHPPRVHAQDAHEPTRGARRSTPTRRRSGHQVQAPSAVARAAAQDPGAGPCARGRRHMTNPTHVAVALRYRPGEILGPVVIAKGAGSLAAMIRRFARPASGACDAPAHAGACAL